VDTLRIEQRRLALRQHAPQSGELRLEACRRRYGLPDYPAHDALVDAVAAAELLLAQASHAGGERGLTLGQLLALSRWQP
jgi:DNA polymerase III subunit epsilon